MQSTRYFLNHEKLMRTVPNHLHLQTIIITVDVLVRRPSSVLWGIHVCLLFCSEEEVRKAVARVHPISYLQKIVSELSFALPPWHMHCFSLTVGFVWSPCGHTPQLRVLSGQLQLATGDRVFQGTVPSIADKPEGGREEDSFKNL